LLRKLETMKQNGQTVEEIVNEFWILKAWAKIDDSPSQYECSTKSWTHPSLWKFSLTSTNLIPLKIQEWQKELLTNIDGSPKPSNMIRSIKMPEPDNEKTMVATTTMTTETEISGNQSRKKMSALGTTQRWLLTKTQMPWISILSLLLSMPWPMKNEASTWRKDFASIANNLGIFLVTAQGRIPDDWHPMELGIGTGNPGVFQGYPYPYPRKPAPMPKGMGMGTGSAKTRGYSTRARVCSKTNSETSQQQCKCQSTPPCSIARLAIRGWLAYTH